MKKIITILLLLLSLTLTAAPNPFTSSAGKKGCDKIMLRDGSMIDAKIQQITQNSVKFKNETTGVKLDELPLSDIYLIKSNKRGNLFFTRDGRRKTGESIEIDPKAIAIYTIDYREIPAYSIEFDVDKIIYQTAKPDRKNPQPLRKIIPQSIVFMILYPDGTSDILNDLTKEQTYVPQSAPEQEEKAQPQDDLKVVFHTVKQGDTVLSIANRYDISASDLREWNEISSRTKDTAPLKPGQQLMLYVRNNN